MPPTCASGIAKVVESSWRPPCESSPPVPGRVIRRHCVVIAWSHIKPEHTAGRAPAIPSSLLGPSLHLHRERPGAQRGGVQGRKQKSGSTVPKAPSRNAADAARYAPTNRRHPSRNASHKSPVLAWHSGIGLRFGCSAPEDLGARRTWRGRTAETWVPPIFASGIAKCAKTSWRSLSESSPPAPGGVIRRHAWS